MSKPKRCALSLPNGRSYFSLQIMILSSFSPQHTRSSLKWFRLEVTPPLGMRCIKWGTNQSKCCTQKINCNKLNCPFQLSIQFAYPSWVFWILNYGDHIIAYIRRSNNNPSWILPGFIILLGCICWWFRSTHAPVESI